jgi:hypothetical protein
MCKKIRKVILLILIITSINVFSQNNIGDRYYEDGEYTLVSVIATIEKSGFELQNRDISMEVFKRAVIKLGEGSIRQLNINTRFLCTNKHEENFEIWNMFYKKISKEFYRENCEQLIALMLLDGIIDDPK